MSCGVGPAGVVVWSPTAIMIHDTGGLAAPEVTARKLAGDGLSVHAIIGRDGRRLAMRPLTRRAAHAGPANAFALAIELTNPVWPPRLSIKAATVFQRTGRLPDGYVLSKQLELGVDLYRGQQRHVVLHTEAQLDELRRTVEQYASRFGIDVAVQPDSDAGMPSARTTGLLGHNQVTNAHVDPVGDVWRALR